MNIHNHFCLCWISKIQDWLKNRFYDQTAHRYKHPWVLYLGVALYLLHWLWHIAVGTVVVSFFYQLCER